MNNGPYINCTCEPFGACFLRNGIQYKGLQCRLPPLPRMMKRVQGTNPSLTFSSSCCTDMSKKTKGRLRELAPVARGSQDAGSRNLAFAFFLTYLYKLGEFRPKEESASAGTSIVHIWQWKATEYTVHIDRIGAMAYVQSSGSHSQLFSRVISTSVNSDNTVQSGIQNASKWGASCIIPLC